MMNISSAAILAERLRRQRLAAPLEHVDGYIALFQLLQPVSTIAYTRPGDPPRLVYRTRFDDGRLARRLRSERGIVKGRFLGGGIGYVLAKDLDTYANAFQRPMTGLTYTQEIVLNAVQGAGPLTPRQLKEETGLLNKQIMPALHRLQKAFLVYEDQVDDDWERSWYDFEAEWSQVELSEERRSSAVMQVLLRFLQGHVFATFEQIKDWSQLTTRLLKQLVPEMEKTRLIVPQHVEGLGTGWLRASDAALPEKAVRPAVFALHRGDILVRSHARELKRRFGGLEVLQYLLIDGQFQGAVVGHWRIGPYDIDDIVVTLHAQERVTRRAEILDAVAQWYRPPRHHILSYDGGPL
jgi:hypothetical protein